MPNSRGIRAWIEVDEKPLPEYGTQDDFRRTTCFIPSEEGKRFTVQFKNVEPLLSAVRGNVFLDGVPAGSRILLSTDTHPAKVSGQTKWEGFECPYQFSKLKTTDDESAACQDENRLRELGTIRLRIEWVQVVSQEPWRAPAASTAPTPDAPVFERAKKAGSHCATFGVVEVSRPKLWYSTTRITYIEPVDFVFQYASRDWLQAKNIISVPSSTVDKHPRKRSPETASLGPSVDEPRGKRPRETTTVDTESDGSVIDGLDEEEAAAYRRLRAKLASRHNRKHQKVKSEPRGNAAAGSSATEIIDLTGDD